MASMQEYSLTLTGRQNVPGTVRSYTLTAKVYNDAGTLVADFTGANAIAFPQVLATLTDAQNDELTNMVANWLILQKAGLPNG